MVPAEVRFVEAFDALHALRRVGVNEFCRELGVSRGTFSSWKSGTTNRHAKVEWFTALCRRGVSAEWLLLGTGDMFVFGEKSNITAPLCSISGKK